MFKVNRLADYAVVLMQAIATTGAEAVSATVLAQTTKIPHETVRKVLKQLLAANLLSANRGPNGGYYLVRAAKDICLSDMVAAAEMQLTVTDCQTYQAKCAAKQNCNMRPHWQRLNGLFLMIMQQISLADLLTDKNNKQNIHAESWSLDYSFVQQLQSMGYVKEYVNE